jgi:hypothetical protein
MPRCALRHCRYGLWDCGRVDQCRGWWTGAPRRRLRSARIVKTRGFAGRRAASGSERPVESSSHAPGAARITSPLTINLLGKGPFYPSFPSTLAQLAHREKNHARA